MLGDVVSNTTLRRYSAARFPAKSWVFAVTNTLSLSSRPVKSNVPENSLLATDTLIDLPPIFTITCWPFSRPVVVPLNTTPDTNAALMVSGIIKVSMLPAVVSKINESKNCAALLPARSLTFALIVRLLLSVTPKRLTVPENSPWLTVAVLMTPPTLTVTPCPSSTPWVVP